MKISRSEVEHAALLARLQLTEEEMNQYTEQLNSILEHAAMLDQIDTGNVSPTAHAVQLYNVLRDDVAQPSLDQEKVLQNAPAAEQGFFRVPRIV
ncbi:MAG: Aspartyl/glutamyl-tRNA(Asn/Gln) amidotransferase subunit C [Candidatus Dichloromethanomonas elyunquensis]|nr:MAG: Aspartyl/glutamyl-tRNA(Asn/Gln) amidotransferase subunit C [Candidatus Dichloromethanomonas elyunquensis]